MIYGTLGQFIGFHIGFLLSFGTHELSLGFQTKSYLGFEYAQLNVGHSILWKLYSLGDRRFFLENRTYGGLCLMAGPDRSPIDFELDGLAHQTHKNYAVSFNYLLYFDRVGTSQLSGAFGLYIKNISIRFENDVFGGQARDRFRTGIVHVTYRTNENKISAGLYLWTGETKGSFWEKSVKTKKMPNGYRILEELPYGKTSHGIAYLGLHHRLANWNVAHIKIGTDSEQTRHFFQNRLIHDLIFLPKNMERHTPHYPRLDQNGCMVFDKKDIRKTRYYLQAGLNAIDH